MQQAQPIIEAVVTALYAGHITIDDFFDNLLNHPVAGPVVSEKAPALCEKLYRKNPATVFDWAFGILEQKLCGEVISLSRREHGLHFNSKRANPDYVEGSFMQKTAEKIRTIGPYLWKLVGSLLDANAKRRRRGPVARAAPSEDSVLKKMGSGVEMDLDEIGDYAGMNFDGGEGSSHDMDIDGDSSKSSDSEGSSTDNESENTSSRRHKEPDTKGAQRAQRQAELKVALGIVKSVVAISIFLQSSNERCNYLQSLLGLFFHSTAVPEKAINTLAHAGLSISLSSIHRALDSLSEKAAQGVRATVRTLQAAFAYDNFDTNFKTSEPTVQHRSIFVSATSATVIPLYDVVNPDSLRCSDELWRKDPLNPRATHETVKLDINNLMKLHEENPLFGDRVSPPEDADPSANVNAWHIRNILIEQAPGFTHFSKQNGQPKTINQIPIHQTKQVPCRAMNIKESTPDGNMEVLENLLRQGGIGDPADDEFDPTQDIDMSEYVIFAHGDLLSKERVESVRISRRIEATPKRRFQYVIFIPGLFHFKMAAADALWRIWVQPVNGRHDSNSLYKHIGILRPDETGKFASKPGFCRMHDVIHHDIWASMLDCWKREAAQYNAAWSSLNAFAEAKPSWDLIVKLSEKIAEKYIATTPGISDQRFEPKEKRDINFENQTLRNRDELLYLELSHAMNMGDIGRVEATFLPWIYIFKATGKHKYAAHTLRFMFQLRDLYPPEISRLIRMNWLCNPTGKPGGFRGVDWLVERNNLYTKVVFGGSGSNRTIDRIIKESILIEHFRDCHVAIENGFHLEHRTIQHAKPDMTRTITQLCNHITSCSPHEFAAGRGQLGVKDMIEEGINLFLKAGTQILNTEEDTAAEPIELDADDFVE